MIKMELLLHKTYINKHQNRTIPTEILQFYRIYSNFYQKGIVKTRKKSLFHSYCSVLVVINWYLIERTEFHCSKCKIILAFWLFHWLHNKWYISHSSPITGYELRIIDIECAHDTDTLTWTIDSKCLNIECALYLTRSGKFLFFCMCVDVTVPMAIVVDCVLKVAVWLHSMCNMNVILRY